MAAAAGKSFCPGCRIGEHRQHEQNWHPAPPCPFGGLMCDCDGRCRIRNDDEEEDVSVQ